MKKKTSRRANSKKTSRSKTKQNSTGANPLFDLFGQTAFESYQLSLPYELGVNNSYNPLTLNRILLSYAYMTHGIVQTMIDQPVEDAFRGGLELTCDELNEDELDLLNRYLNLFILPQVKSVMKWAKLYGGAGLIINTDQDPTKQLNEDSISENSPLTFIVADRWELVLEFTGQHSSNPCPYNYYGQPIHRSRVLKVMGKEAPSYIRQRLQGWGMSELERTIRALNSYVKNEDVIYDLLDEAKVDVWRMEGFNANVLKPAANGQLDQRLQISNRMKNYLRAVVMDKEDEYEQKQIAFSGLPEILNQNRIGAAAAVRMPMAKLFGLSAAGFNSGEDDIENYNALIESEVRAKATEVLIDILPLCCRQLFGAPFDVDFKYKPLRVLSEEQEENIKTAKANRYSNLYQQGMLTPQEYAILNKKAGVVEIETEVEKGTIEPEPPQSPDSVPTPQEPNKNISGA